LGTAISDAASSKPARSAAGAARWPEAPPKLMSSFGTGIMADISIERAILSRAAERGFNLD
jgi:hypothetical protein